MSYITNYQYYYNGGTVPENANHGEYQYLSIKDIINNFMLMYIGEDKQLDNVRIHEVRFHAKQVTKRLNYDAFRSIRVLKETIGSTLRLTMPHDYVDYIRISLEKDGVLYPMTENTKPYVADVYLKDNNDEILFDGNGEVLTSEEQLNTEDSSTSNVVDNCCGYSVHTGARYWLEPSKANSNPKFFIDRRKGYVDFASNMQDENIVIEYISDGMEGGDDDQIVIHKFFEKYIYLYMFHSILNAKFGMPKWRIDDASKAATAEFKNAKIRIMDLNPERLLMPLRGQAKWIK